MDDAIDVFDLRAATGVIVAEVDAVNREIERVQPWTLRGDERASEVTRFAADTRAIVDELGPFVPDLAARAAQRLDGTQEAPVFARLS